MSCAKPHRPKSPRAFNYKGEELVVNAIVYDEVKIPVEDEIETTAKLHLREAAETSRLDTLGDAFVYGNSRGYSLLDDMCSMKRDMKALLKSTKTLSSQMEEQGLEIESLKGQVGVLTQTSQSYLEIRRRFFDTYQRDVKNDATLKGSLAVKVGNARAHGGDALADAALFDQDNRSDTGLYRELYGLDHRKVLDLHKAAINNGIIISTINAHATLLARRKQLSNDLQEAFKTFVSRAESAWLKPPSDDPKDPLKRAYDEVWTILRQHMR